MAATLLDTTAAQIEKVRPKLENYFEQSDQIAALIKPSEEAEVVSNYLYRIPFKLYNGGNYGKFSADGGVLGEGTSLKLNNLIAGYVYSRHAVRLTTEQIDTSKSKEQSTINVLADALANAMREVQVNDDISFHNDGTGLLTNSGSATNGTTTITFAAATDRLGVNRLREGMTVDVWDVNGTTKRAGAGSGPIVIIRIDWSGKVVTFNQTVTAIASDDKLAFTGLDSYGPAGLTSFSSTWPQRGQAGGLGGDSFRHGLYYANDITSANYFLQVQKSVVPQLLPSRVNASAALSFSHGLQIKDKIVQRRDADVLNGLIGIFHMAQRAQMFNIGISILNKFVTGESFGKSLDVMPSNHNYGDTFEFDGVTCHLSKRQFTNRVDFINPSKWGRAKLHDTKYWGDEVGQTVFPVRDGNGVLKAAIEFFLVQAYDFICFDPGAQGYIDNLDVPTGY